MGNGKLAVLLPTYRFDATAQHCIRTAASMGGDDIDVFIGDNSGNPEKWAFLEEVAASAKNCHVICNERDIGGPANWRQLLMKVEHEFICPVSDDDCFTPDYFLAGLETLRRDPDCSAAHGLILFTRYDQQQMEVSVPRSLDQRTPLERIVNFFIWTPSMEYSVHRSEIAFWFQNYVDSRPYVLGFTNQFLDYAIVMRGKYMIDHNRRIFVYNNHNWANEAQGYVYEGKYYEAAGFPRDCSYLQFVFWAADILHFFHSDFRPRNVSDEDNMKIMAVLFETVFGYVFRLHLERYKDHIGKLLQRTPQSLAPFIQLSTVTWREPQRFLWLFVEMLRGFNPVLAERYRTFVETTTCFKHLSAPALELFVA